MSSETKQEKYERRLEREYKELQDKLEENIRKDEARQRILKQKRDERQAIKKGGGGKNISRAILGGGRVSNDTDFSFGHNTPEANSEESGVDIDRRIAQEAANRCMGRVYCHICKTFHGYCAEVNEQKEKMKMLPTGDNSSGTQNRSRTGGLNFINAQDLSTQKQEAKILMVKFKEKDRTGKSRPSITIKLAFKGEMRYIWVPCQKDDVRYSTLLTAFGPDENDWVDERITLSLEKDDFSENYQVKIDAIKETATKKGGRS